MVEILGAPAADDVPVLEELAEVQAAVPDDGVAMLQEDDADELPAHAVLLPDGRVRLPLLIAASISYRKPSKPDVHREIYRELVFRRLNGADMRAIMAAGKGADPVVTAIARSAGIHQPVMQLLYDAMDGADVGAASQVVAHFLGNGPKTGR